MKSITDYLQPFDAIADFERIIGEYTGAPYVVVTDSCTHALEMCLRLNRPNGDVGLPARTYLSVPMTLHKLDIRYWYLNFQWCNEYNIVNTKIWDSARRFDPDMYMEGQYQCLSFGHTKPLQLGRGGAILLDNAEHYEMLKRMVYDGRDLSISPWEDQETFLVGYHYRLTPEECIIGINKMLDNDIDTTKRQWDYPDLRNITIIDPYYNKC